MLSAQVMWKYLASFFKREWKARDYPLRVRVFEGDPNTFDTSHLRPIPYSAQVVNWWQMSGAGVTPDAAVVDLDTKLQARRREGKPLPRPGTGLPLEWAPTHRVGEHPDLAADFVKRILDVNYNECFISDDSSLWDFHNHEDNSHLYEKIILAYGVDVSDVESARIVEILERLTSRGVSA